MAEQEIEVHDLNTVLCSSGRDFLIRNNGEQIKVGSLKGKRVGLYFSASWCGPCQRFTPTLVEVYNELLPKNDFEVVFISGDDSDESFNEYFSKMPWLAIPYSDSETRDRMDELFSVRGIPHLVIVDESGKVVIDNGVETIRAYGAEAYPFTSERMKEFKEQEEVARREQSLKSILVSGSRDYVLDADGKKVPVTELEGKTVGLYYVLPNFNSITAFTPKLIELCENLKEKGEKFEIVMIPLIEDEESFKTTFKNTPWFSLPVGDKSCEKLVRYFELSTLPTVVILGPDGKTLHSNAADAIEEHGSLAYPFTPERFTELEQIEQAKQEAQTLESFLVSGDRNFVIGKGGVKFPVSDLVGKHVLLYFSAHWCPPCRAFLPKLIEAYNEIKGKFDAFEVVFISSDRDQNSFDEFYSTMPWMAIPFGDERKQSLSKKFKVKGIPMLVAIGPTGKTITTEARDLITLHGANAYPFTNERLKEIEAEYDEMAKGWPEKVKNASHEHELVLSRRVSYVCDGCDKGGQIWSFYCEECDFDLHPKCALEEKEESKPETDAGVANEEHKDEWICDGEVCHKA